MKRYRLSSTAQADFEEAAEFWRSKSIAAEERWEARLLDALQHIADWPDSGYTRTVIDTSPSTRFWTVEDYIIMYDSSAEPIFVLSILHGARDIPHVIKERREK